MAHCYRIVKENIHRDQPNFDKDKMEQNIDKLQKDIKEAMKALQMLKGEYFSVSDLIINQDTFTFKFDTV